MIDTLRQALAASYRLERELGAGGMAVVYRARDLRHDRAVAVKVIRPELALSIGAERFVREIQFAARLTHPNILPIYDSGRAGEHVLYYVMPLIEGESLRGRLDREHQLPLDDAVRIVSEIADGLSHAHAHGVIHRDVKPENVLLAEGRAVIADFGIARAVDRGEVESLTETGIALGSPHYMSPEQATGEADLDQRTDVYSLGCILYELLVGEPPFLGPNPMAITARKLNAVTPSIRVVRPTVPEAVERVSYRALARLRVDRFETAEALGRALRAAAADAAETPPRVRRSGLRSAWSAWSAAVAGLGRLASAGVSASRNLALGSAAIRSVAVLPLSNLMKDTGEDYFVDGMHEAIIAGISTIAGLRVISRTSVMQYRGTTKSMTEIARELNVDGIIEGSVFRSGDSVRISVALLGVRPERRLWSETYTGSLTQVLKLQDDIASAVAQQLAGTVTGRVSTRPATAELLVNPAAHAAYLRGRYQWQRQTEMAVEASIKEFDEALRIDPMFAPAYAGLADAFIVLTWAGLHPLPWHDGYQKAKASAMKALELDTTISAAHTSLGIVLWRYDWDWTGAEREFRRALELNPNSAEAEHWYAMFLASRGRPAEAIEAMQRARVLDPLSLLVGSNTGWVLYFARQHAAGIAQGLEAQRVWPSFGHIHYMLGLNNEQLGRYTEAIAEFEHAIELSGDLAMLLGAVGHAYALGGRTDDACRVLARMTERGAVVPPSLLALVHVGLGDWANALRKLEAACGQRDPYLVFVDVNPVWDPLRNEPRFQEVLSRVNAKSLVGG